MQKRMGKLCRHRQHDVELAHVWQPVAKPKFADVNRARTVQRHHSGMSLDGHYLLLSQSTGPSIRLSYDKARGEQFATRGMTLPAAPPNLERTFGSLPGYFYSTSKRRSIRDSNDNSVLDGIWKTVPRED